jgi:ribosomal protein S30
MKCGAIVEPFTALEHLALHSERLDKYVDNINAHIKKLLERVKELDNYKPRLRVIKELEQRYRKCNKDRLNPTCPKCGMAFELEEILSTIWTIREGVER